MRGFILGLMPATMRRNAETESRQWRAACPNCGAINSIWDIGGIRYRAAGQPTRRVRCPSCRRIGPHTFTKHDA